MRCTCILSSFACSLFARSANHGPLIFTDDGFQEPQAMNTGAGANGNGNGGAYGDNTSGANTNGVTQTGTGTGKDDSPLVLPLVTGGILFILLWTVWFGWRWYEGRGGSGEDDEGDGEGEGESGRISTRMNAVPPPKLWEVEIYHHEHVVRPLAVSLDDDEVHEYEVGKVRISVLSAFDFIRD